MTYIRFLKRISLNLATEKAAWQSSALCAQSDPELFFPDLHGPTKEARATCGRCEVREPCLDFAMNNDERFGLWGGLDEKQRARLRRKVAR